MSVFALAKPDAHFHEVVLRAGVSHARLHVRHLHGHLHRHEPCFQRGTKRATRDDVNQPWQ